jgi:hypothetical protein
MRKLEYAKGTCYEKNKIIKIIKPGQSLLNYNQKDSYRRKSVFNNILDKQSSFGQIDEAEEIEDKIYHDNISEYKNIINTNYFEKCFIIKIQRWWRKKYYIMIQIKFLQHHIREYLLNKKYPKKFQSLIYRLFDLHDFTKSYMKKIAFTKINSHLKMHRDLLPKIIKIQRIIKIYLKLIKQRKYDSLYKRLDNLNRFLLAIILKDGKIKKNLIEHYGLKKVSENEFHEIKLNVESNKFIENNKQNGNLKIQKDKDSIDVEMGNKSIKSLRSSRQEFIKNSLDDINSVLNNSNKDKNIVLKSSSRDFLNEENTDNRLTKISSDKKLKTSEEFMNSKLKKFKEKRIRYVVDDDDDVNSSCYSKSCKCNIY